MPAPLRWKKASGDAAGDVEGYDSDSSTATIWPGDPGTGTASATGTVTNAGTAMGGQPGTQTGATLRPPPPGPKSPRRDSSAAGVVAICERREREEEV